ncbi:hypothetical protein BDP27DRAFT_1448426 [Rhodocollybia butyracea]|uniref:Uncharacterized protein n=1 Tax=Rhodocollybia butyracea TaxID=206335 RepID=A0A9P5U733_9AGAR|nr:hypothetical protein BDP27DRAFT_1448426 [Rhodocollybia butyracea]
MLLPHHWLVFALLTVLVFPVCAAPVSPARPGLRKPSRIKNQTRIKKLIYNVGEGLNDGKGSGGKEVEFTEPDSEEHAVDSEPDGNTKLAYFEFSGSRSDSTPATQKWYGYVVVTKGYSTTIMTVGAVITRTGENSYTVVDQLPPSQYKYPAAQFTHQLKYYEFLKTFRLIKDWANAMAKDTAVLTVSPVLRAINVHNEPKAPPNPAFLRPAPGKPATPPPLRPLHPKPGADGLVYFSYGNWRLT